MIITIGREFGSGGKYIGEQLAKELNMKLYDDELITRVVVIIYQTDYKGLQ